MICVLPQLKIVKRQLGHIRSCDRLAGPSFSSPAKARHLASLTRLPLSIPAAGTACDVGLLAPYLRRLIYGPVIPMVENSLEVRTEAFSSGSAGSDTVPLVGAAGCLSHPSLAARRPPAGPFGCQECWMLTASPGTALGGSTIAQHCVLTAGRPSSGGLSA